MCNKSDILAKYHQIILYNPIDEDYLWPGIYILAVSPPHGGGGILKKSKQGRMLEKTKKRTKRGKRVKRGGNSIKKEGTYPDFISLFNIGPNMTAK